MRSLSRYSTAFALLVSFSSVAPGQSTAPAKAKPKPAAAKVAAAKTTPAKPALEPGRYANLLTNQGAILIKFYDNESPITVRNFVELAQGKKEWTDPKTGEKTMRPLYDGLTFHRVIPSFMIQGGDPEGTGMGGTTEIPDEFNASLSFDRPGRVAMANRGPMTGSSQFFITEVPTPHLDGKHTIFGQVVEGQDVVDKIARVPASPDDSKPLTPVRIIKVTIREVRASAPGKPKPAKRKPVAAKPKPAA